MQDFSEIIRVAEKRKGGKAKLKQLLPPVPQNSTISTQGDDRFLSMMTKCINQAGFHWGVIEKKWPEFEAAYFGFHIEKLSLLSDEQWESYMEDARIVRNWQKILATKENVLFILQEQDQHGSFGAFVQEWPVDDQVGLMLYLKRHGSRLGGNTGQRFLRNMGKDAFYLSGDVVLTLQNAGLEINDSPSSQRDLRAIQNAFNNWHNETGLPYAHISRIAAYASGTNYSVAEIVGYLDKDAT